MSLSELKRRRTFAVISHPDAGKTTPTEKLLQILLVGQPELDEKLDSQDLRQLKQRIALRSHLNPLDLDETNGYIHRRLQLAGSPNAEALFPMDTVLEIHRHSRGIPRLINTLCENGLIHGYARQSQKITPEMIEEIALEFRLNVVNPEAPANRTVSGEPATDVEQAARTLLDLYAGLRKVQSNRDELRVALDAEMRKHEPYI